MLWAGGASLVVREGVAPNVTSPLSVTCNVIGTLLPRRLCAAGATEVELGKKFVLEFSRFFRAYAEGSALESVALRAITVMSILLLQKPARNSKSKDHSACLERRLLIWQAEDINNLVLEGKMPPEVPPKNLTSEQT